MRRLCARVCAVSSTSPEYLSTLGSRLVTAVLACVLVAAAGDEVEPGGGPVKDRAGFIPQAQVRRPEVARPSASSSATSSP